MAGPIPPHQLRIIIGSWEVFEFIKLIAQFLMLEKLSSEVEEGTSKIDLQHLDWSFSMSSLESLMWIICNFNATSNISLNIILFILCIFEIIYVHRDNEKLRKNISCI